MIRQANCKINLGLYITGKRPDGFHNLETIFLPIPLYDELEIEVSETFGFRSEGIPIDGETENNLCVKAYRLLRNDFPQIGNVRMRLLKRIPYGAGLGGGSSDAAETLKMLNEIFQLQLSVPELQAYASRLGSDCAVFIENRPVFATGRGDILEALPRMDFSAWELLLLKPDEAVSTAEAYRDILARPAPCDLRQAVRQPIFTWEQHIHNQFEQSVFPKHPRIQACKEWLYEKGAVYASMSGSGSCVYGFFAKESAPQTGDDDVFALRLNL